MAGSARVGSRSKGNAAPKVGWRHRRNPAPRTLARAIGSTGASANVFATANTLPNTFLALIGGGVLNAVLVPQIAQASRRGERGREYVDRLLTIAVAVLASATVVLTALATPLFLVYWSHGPSADVVHLGTAFALWCLPQVFFYGLYTLLGQVLNARGSFGPYMWAPVVNNVVSIVGILAFVGYAGAGARPVTWWGADTATLLAGTTTLGVVAQALVLIPVLRRSGFRWRAGRVASLLALATAAPVMIAMYGGLLRSRHADEFDAFLSPVLQRLGRSGRERSAGRHVVDDESRHQPQR